MSENIPQSDHHITGNNLEQIILVPTIVSNEDFHMEEVTFKLSNRVEEIEETDRNGDGTNNECEETQVIVPLVSNNPFQDEEENIHHEENQEFNFQEVSECTADDSTSDLSKETIIDEELDQEWKSINDLKRKINELGNVYETIKEHSNEMERSLKKRRERDTLLTSDIPHTEQIIRYFENYKKHRFCNWLEENNKPLTELATLHLVIFKQMEERLVNEIEQVIKTDVFSFVSTISSKAQNMVNEIIFMYIPKIVEKFSSDYEGLKIFLEEKGCNLLFESEKDYINFLTHVLLTKVVSRPIRFEYNLPEDVQVNKINQKIHLPSSLDLSSGKIVKIIIPRLLFDEDDSIALEGLYLVE